MRKPPGTFYVAIEAVIIKGKKILITQRSFEREHDPGEWEILTGRVNQGETFEEAAKREVLEEVGLKDIEILEPFNTFHFYRDPKKEEHLGVSFACKYKKGKIVLDKNEQINYKWATPEEAEKLIKIKGVLSSVRKVKKYL